MLVHGIAGDRTRWANIIDVLNQSFTAYALDRRGRGDSADGPDYYIEREFEDIVAVIDGIGGQVDVLAHSYGAVCALEAALRSPHVRRLALYEPPLPLGGDFYPPQLIGHLAQLFEDGDRDAVVTTLFRANGTSDIELELLRTHPGWQGRVDAAHTIIREMRITEAYRPDFARFERLEIPVLLLTGSESPAPLTEATTRLHHSLPNSRLVSMAGQQHIAMDTAPDLFLDAARAFFAQ